MATELLTPALVTIVRSWTETGPSGKLRRGLVARFADPVTSGGMTVGGSAHLMPATAFGLTKIESCGSVLVYTTATGAPLRVYPAAPSYNGVNLHATNAGTGTDSEAARNAVLDIALANAETAQVELHGY